MKTINTLILAGTVAFSFAAANIVSAAEAVHSPRGQANQTTRVSGTNTDRNLVSGQYLGAQLKSLNAFHSMVASGSVKDINLAKADYLGAAAKSPQRDLKGVQFEIAPLIEKRDACHK
jgi:hypothetical protein